MNARSVLRFLLVVAGLFAGRTAFGWGASSVTLGADTVFTTEAHRLSSGSTSIVVTYGANHGTSVQGYVNWWYKLKAASTYTRGSTYPIGTLSGTMTIELGTYGNTAVYDIGIMACFYNGTFTDGPLSQENATVAAKQINLTATNSSPAGTNKRLYAWGPEGNDAFYDPVWLAGGGSKTWTITIQPTDTKKYVVKLINVETATKNGTLNAVWGEGKKPGLDPPDYYDAGSGGTVAQGTAKGYADAEDIPSGGGTTNGTPSTATGAGGAAGTSGTTPQGAVTGGAPGNEVVPGSPTGSPTQQSSADNTNSLLKKLDELNGTMKGVKGGVSGGTDMSGVTSRLDTANNHLDKMEKILTGTDSSQTGYSNGDKIAAGQSAAGAVTPYSGSKPGTGKPTTTLPGGSSALTFGSMTVGTQEISFTLFGGAIGGHSIFWSAIRPVLLLGMCVAFLASIKADVISMTVALPQVAAQDTNTGPENLVPGVSQAKTFGTAAAAVVVIFTGAAALVAAADTMVTYFGSGIASLFAAFSQPAGSVVGALDGIIPVGPAVAFWLMQAAAGYIMLPLFLGTAAVLRFLKT